MGKVGSLAVGRGSWVLASTSGGCFWRVPVILKPLLSCLLVVIRSNTELFSRETLSAGNDQVDFSRWVPGIIMDD